MANVLTVVWFVIAYILAQTGLMVWAALMFPERVRRARERVETRPLGSLFKGILFWSVSVFLAVALLNAKLAPLKLMGWMIVGPMLAGSVLGGAAFAEILSARIRHRSSAVAEVPALVGGALLTTVAGLMPLVGWFVFFPIVTFISIGAGVPSLGRQKKQVAAGLEEFAPVTTSYPPAMVSAVPASQPGMASASFE